MTWWKAWQWSTKSPQMFRQSCNCNQPRLQVGTSRRCC